MSRLLYVVPALVSLLTAIFGLAALVASDAYRRDRKLNALSLAIFFWTVTLALGAYNFYYTTTVLICGERICR